MDFEKELRLLIQKALADGIDVEVILDALDDAHTEIETVQADFDDPID